MHNWESYLLIVVIGYLIGSISFARIIFAFKRPGTEPDRIRSVSTDGKAVLIAHQVGATSVMIAFGRRWGLTATALDMAKAFVPVLALRLVFPEMSYHLFCGAAVLIGHLWPVWYKFSGGGGNSCILGMMLAISPLGLVLTQMGGMLIGKIYPRYLFFAGVVLSIPWFAWRYGIFSPESAFALVISLLYVVSQLPEAIQLERLKKQGYTFEMSQVVDMMKHSDKEDTKS